MPSTSRRIFDLSRPAPDPRQRMTAGSADFAMSWTAGLLVALAIRPLVTAGSPAPFLLLAGVAIVVWALDAVVLVGLTGQSLGARVAQTAEVSASSGRPVGVVTMARMLVGGPAARDWVTRSISLTATPRAWTGQTAKH